uniref:cAMP dependent protein kinase catalytic subunit n=1 Tax=Ganoderma boninense TaxID=34458 RepID=A0A5K1JV21_9APHY|nr:cAMP dependent protein kinase catalytic subunit [Ganoderma boninense]
MNFHVSSYVSGPAKIMLMSPTLQHFQLSMRALEKSPPESSDLILLELQPVFHSVQSLSIDLQSGKDETPRTIEFWTCTQLHTLKVVHKLALTPEIIQPLTTFPHLRSLDLHIQNINFGESESEEQPRPSLSGGFAELRELSLSGKLSDISAFLEATAPPDLESLSITITQDIVDDLSADDRRRELDSVYSKIPSTLHRLSLALENGNVSDSDLIPRAADLLAPLHRLPDLRRLAFRTDIYVALADADLRALADRWPRLAGFEWTYAKRTLERMDENKISVAWGDGTVPAVPTLIAFAQAHPQLRRLTLPYVDLGSVPPLAEVPALAHGLELLVIHYLRPKVPLHMLGLVLDRLFPDLTCPRT